MEYEVVIYTYLGTWKLRSDLKMKFIRKEEEINLFFQAANVVGLSLNLVSEEMIETLSHFSMKPFRNLVKYISHHCFEINKKIFIPVSLIIEEYFNSDLNIENIQEIPERFQIAERMFGKTQSFASYLMANEVDFSGFSAFQHPEYILLLLEDYEPWPGIEEGLYAGFFKQGVEKWNFYYCSRNEFPEDNALHSVKGVVITGAKYGANDKDDWINRLGNLILRSDQMGIRITAICLGHQLAAKVFGGTVGSNPGGQFICEAGNVEFKQEIKQFYLTQCHGDCVETMPENGVILASSENCKVEVMKVGKGCLGVQCHPEYTSQFIYKYYAPSFRRMGEMTESEYLRIMKSCERRTDSVEFIEYMNMFLRKLIDL